jgi:ABC-2 type transport system ATP-binding protein
VHDPKVLFLDEPTTGLDPVSRITIWEEVRKLNDEGTTVFLTTQYLEEADQLADRVGIIDEGRMAAEGTPGALKAQIGRAHLEITISEGGGPQAVEILARFGEPLPTRDGVLMVSLEGGASDVAPVVRALDDAGLFVESLELVKPTLDDVFVEKTGRHLEGAGEEQQPEPEAQTA